MQPTEYYKNGKEIIKKALAGMPNLPGVYRMIDKEGKMLYIGKAKNLPKRIINYTQDTRLSNRHLTMISQVHSLEIITTSTEAEALLLEASLIKSLKPKYNILLRDDKTFPYILIKKDHDFPQLMKYRGKKKDPGKYFGPFAAAREVTEVITQLEKIFLLRSCSDNYFKNRKRPCILYQIKRCSAPCVNKISIPDYQELVKQSENFLSGKTVELQKHLSEVMQNLSDNMDYEQAAKYRDRIKALTLIQNSRPDIIDAGVDDADIFAVEKSLDIVCVEGFFIRAGKNLGNRAFFPVQAEDSSKATIISAFIGQFYQTHPAPKLIIINEELEEASLLSEMLTKMAGHKVRIITPKSGPKYKLLELTINNAREAVNHRLSNKSKNALLLEKLRNYFAIEQPIEKVEVFDNSHMMGKNAVGAMIVAGKDGFIKDEYRKYNMDKLGEHGGDDYKMLAHMLSRRIEKIKKNKETTPDLWLIDGGLGQLNIALRILENEELNIAVIAVAKGPDRNAGRETFFMQNKQPFSIPHHDELLHYLQRLRDEAHRFAIGSHRIRRANAFIESRLDKIPGIGPKRKKILLDHFGGIENIKNASLGDLAKVGKVGSELAKVIKQHLSN